MEIVEWDHGIVGVCGGVGRERGRLFLSRLSDVLWAHLHSDALHGVKSELQGYL